MFWMKIMTQPLVLLVMVINSEIGQPLPNVAFAVNDHEGDANCKAVGLTNTVVTDCAT